MSPQDEGLGARRVIPKGENLVGEGQDALMSDFYLSLGLVEVWRRKGHSLVDGLAELLQAHVVGVQEVQLGRVPGRQLRLDFLPHTMLR